MEHVSGQVKELKKLVIANQDTLLALHTNRDKPEIFTEVLRKLKSMCKPLKNHLSHSPSLPLSQVLRIWWLGPQLLGSSWLLEN